MSEIVNPRPSYGKKMCVSCQADVEDKTAFPIKEDRIIRGLRAIKMRLGIAQMNKLFVCESCVPKHAERRRSFERTMLFASVFAGFVVLLLLYSTISSGRFDAWVVISAFVVALFALLLSLFRYAPAIESGSFQPSKPPPPAPVPEPEEPEERPETAAKKKPAYKPKKKR
ncbi:hypothetical protein H0O00_02960 [Candidatus Micrarchaeota archaeon]|nr:hypothetical protein [Candidatus Micrarchaeota archaeon]